MLFFAAYFHFSIWHDFFLFKMDGLEQIHIPTLPKEREDRDKREEENERDKGEDH